MIPYTLPWTAGLHHDGSALYVSNPLPAAGEAVTLKLRTPLNAPIHSVFLRTTPDGEGHYTPMQISHRDAVSVWYSVEIHMTMPRLNYRFILFAAEGLIVFNAAGVQHAETLDILDFKLLADFDTPDWLTDRVFYQIFPDRFHNGDPALDIPEGAWHYYSSNGKAYPTRRAAWDDLPRSYAEVGSQEFYNGDLPGITQKLDYLTELGVNALYLTPIFTSISNHRYNASDFYAIDPHLGGNAALAKLRQESRARDIRLILDVTPNHTGTAHTWFQAAQADANAPSAAYYTFRQHPHEYEAWLGHKSLPKLNYQNAALRDAMYRSPDSVLRHWLNAPYSIDGWRLDVLNMTGNQGMAQLGIEIAHEIRHAVKAEAANAYIVGEHFFDGTPYLQGDALDAVQNYQGFTMALRHWLVGHGLQGPWEGFEPAAPKMRTTAAALAEHMRTFYAPVPFVIARQQFNQLNSHDIPRLLTLLNGDRSLVKLATTVLMTYPGVPCIYYGDEVGLEGGDDEDKRRPMLWDTARWDVDLLSFHQRLIALRKSAPALRDGGIQWLAAHDDLIAYQRHSAEQRIVVIAYRGPGELREVQLPVWHGGLADGVSLRDFLTGAVYAVEKGMLALGAVTSGTVLILEAAGA